jgi:glycosyltransferase involved in cell wall biosynthesis
VARRLRVAWLGQRSAGRGDGLITYSRETTRGLRQRGIDVVFFHHDAESAHEGVRLHAYSVSHKFRIAAPGSRRRLAEALRRGRVDLVHVSLSFSSLDFELPQLCRELGLPVVATVHAPFDTRLTMWGGLSKVLYRIYSVPLARFDRVIVFGPAQRDVLSQLGVPASALRIVPNGVDVEKYRPGPSDVRERLDCERLFLYMGRLDPEKNVEPLVQAFWEAPVPPGLRLALAGAGSERRRLERRYRGRKLAFLGLVGDEGERIALLRAAEAFFLPSAIEGLSLALLEAMACGVCPVATTVGCDGDALMGVGVPLNPLSLESDLRLAIRFLTETPEVARQLGRMPGSEPSSATRWPATSTP